MHISLECALSLYNQYRRWPAIGGLQMKGKKNTSLKHRIFNVVFLVGIFMSFSCSLINYLLDFGTVETLITLTCGVITVGLYIAFKISKNYELLSLIVVILLSFVFFSNHMARYRGDLRQHSILYNYKCRDNCLIA